MRDYYAYMDFDGYAKAEEQLAAYDFLGYIETLKKVKAKAFEYDGDAMALINFHTGIQDELESINSYYKLSKSTYVRGKQCHKSLFLNKNRKEVRDQLSAETKLLFKKGRHFEDEFRNKLGEGVNLKDKLGHAFSYYPYFTKKLMQLKKELVFEAGFTFEGVLVLVDALQRNDDGSYSVYEIKNSSEIKEVHYWDMAIQYYVLKENLKKIKNFNLVFNEAGTHKVVDLKAALEKRVKSIKDELVEFKAILNSNLEPATSMGDHCNFPYKCDFTGYCKKKSEGSFFDKLLNIVHRGYK
ncbi:CRISPR-associated protein Cas4 [Pontibacter sp. HSC-14F20]|uniref:Dna2/Cas4 domain-containing protein n=1 Tax=Pontibacter sp. HSC-14F20 TaxID=2864136 RepID=UPI001C7332BA|nr:Dna2/Cas4 domain-containing protein [Pontibacter sp. HSC-14F20]MBX0332959.1 CRISPR-associated protein Cas4 [Pontibacter sp. HSC-14F20]